MRLNPYRNQLTSAVACHPVGHPDQTSREKTVFTDKIENVSPMAGNFHFLNKIIMKDKIVTNKNDENKKNIAIYGFTKNQMELVRFIKKDLNIDKGILMIATLNRILGLIKYEHHQLRRAQGQSEKDMVINYIGTMGNNITAKNKSRINNELINSWVDVLSNNKHKTDVFSYINKKQLSLTDKSLLIKKLIVKNTASNINVESIFKVLDSIGIFNSSNIEEACDCLKKNALPLSDIYTIFDLVQTHFFRNTSKLGLDFFKDNGYAISIAWNKDGFGQKINHKMISLEDVLNRPFKQGERRFNNAEPITYSEIRHLVKYYHDFSDIIYRVSFQNQSVLFSSGISNENWFEYKKRNILSSRSGCVVS